MKGLIVNDRLVRQGEFLHYDHMNRIVYHQRVLERWHREKPAIYCACQSGTPVEMHVRRTPTGRYTLVNNKEQSDKHRRACPFYGEVQHVEKDGDPPAAVVRADDKLIVRVSLFPGSADAGDDDQVDDKLEQERSRSPAITSSGGTKSQRHKHTFADFIYDWYLFAVDLIRADKKPMDRKTVLFYMWLALIRHKIVIDTEDFYYHGYVPNPKFNKIKKWKVVVGFVREAEEVYGGQRWILEGWGKVQLRVLVREKHLPKYSVLHKLAAVRVDCDHEEPISIAGAMAWRVTREGWFLFSDAEWELLTLLWKNNVKAERSALWPAPVYGYKPDFLLHGERVKVPILIDVLDDPCEKMEPRIRALDEEEFRMSRFACDVLYVPWRAGDRLDFLKSL